MYLTAAHDEIPRLIADGLPDNEREIAQCISQAIYSLTTYTDDLAAGINLFETATILETEAHKAWKVAFEPIPLKQRVIFGKWMLMAANQSALTVWHFGEAMKTVKTNARTAPVFNTLIDWPTVRLATKLYKKYFPSSEGLRHAIAHVANLTETPKKTVENTTKDSSPWPEFHNPGRTQVFISACLSGHTLVYSWKGVTCKLAVSSDTLMKLVEVRTVFNSAFSNASKHLLQIAINRAERLAASKVNEQEGSS